MKLIFATDNIHKAEEIRKMITDKTILTLSEAGISEDIPETGKTLDENALIKARYVYSRLNVPCFADDTGLEVDALGGAPGVHSARYAGEGKNSEDNIDKLLEELKNANTGTARFRCVIAYIDERGNERLFEGKVEGTILRSRAGTGGFGYDSVFKADGYDLSFAQMNSDEKNKISHRGAAVRKFIDYLGRL